MFLNASTLTTRKFCFCRKPARIHSAGMRDASQSLLVRATQNCIPSSRPDRPWTLTPHQFHASNGSRHDRSSIPTALRGECRKSDSGNTIDAHPHRSSSPAMTRCAEFAIIRRTGSSCPTRNSSRSASECSRAPQVRACVAQPRSTTQLGGGDRMICARMQHVVYQPPPTSSNG